MAVLGVMWLHWAPPEWRGPLPWEIGLFFFFTLSGFLITRILLRERDAAVGGGRLSVARASRAYRDFQVQRALRILVPCYLGMGLAALVGAPDILAHPWTYLAHLSNFHIAFLPDYPAATAHYWTLAIQVQFYLLWPLAILTLPRRLLFPFLLACLTAAPLGRVVIAAAFPAVRHPGAISVCALDYFAAGGLLALALQAGTATKAAADKRIRRLSWLAFAGYAVLYVLQQAGQPVPGLRHLQQTLLAVAMAGLVASSLAPGRPGRRSPLEHPALLHIGRISYGLYLFHNSVPMGLGWVLPWLWQWGEGPAATAARLACFAAVSWLLAWLCWRWVEQPLARIKRRMAGEPSHQPGSSPG